MSTKLVRFAKYVWPNIQIGICIGLLFVASILVMRFLGDWAGIGFLSIVVISSGMKFLWDDFEREEQRRAQEVTNKLMAADMEKLMRSSAGQQIGQANQIKKQFKPY